MAVAFLPSQLGTVRDVPLPYTASPLRLLLADLCLIFRSIWSVPGILLPVFPWRSGPLCELYPSKRNILDVVVNVCLVVWHLLFLVSLLLGVLCLVPAQWMIIWIGGGLVLNYVICKVFLNAGERIVESTVPLDGDLHHDNEFWLYINGIMTGKHYVQSGLDRLAYTFRRKVTGVHNRTHGMVFDLIECMVQRCFGYATEDVRVAYALMKRVLLDPKYDKVVLILHSQGAIEGSLVVDWLLDEIPHEVMNKLEIYTFGSGANHFNNPYTKLSEFRPEMPEEMDKHHQQHSVEQGGKAIRHIEHYADSGDFVSIIGVLNFISVPNRYMGQIFVRPGGGHLFNQHYMDNMFTLDKDRKCLDSNEFMDMEVEVQASAALRPEDETGEILDARDLKPSSPGGMSLAQILIDENGNTLDQRPLKVKDLSRLWAYRNGASPIDPGRRQSETPTSSGLEESLMTR